MQIKDSQYPDFLKNQLAEYFISRKDTRNNTKIQRLSAALRLHLREQIS